MEKLLRPEKVCEILDICPMTLQRWDKAGKITVIRLPYNKRRVSESEVERILNEGIKKPKPLSIKFKILSANSPIEDHLHYGLQQYPTKKKDAEIQKLCKLIETNTKYKFSDIIEKFNNLYREGIIFNEGGTKKSHLVFADDVV